MQTRNVCNSLSRNYLTYLESGFTLSTMALRSIDVITALRQQLTEDSSQIDETYEKMNELRSAYIKYKSLEDHSKQTQQRIRNTLAVLGPAKFPGFGLKDNDEYAAIAEKAGIAGGLAELRERLPLS